METRTLVEWLTIFGELRTLYDRARTAAASDGTITPAEWVALVDAGLGVLVAHKVTIEELRELTTSIVPVLDLFRS